MKVTLTDEVACYLSPGGFVLPSLTVVPPPALAATPSLTISPELTGLLEDSPGEHRRSFWRGII